MEDKLKFERTIRKSGDSISFSMPKEILDYLELKEGTPIQITPEKGKHGKYIAIWKKQDQK